MGLLAPPDPSLRAVVDIGSNSLHLQLARRTPHGLELLESERAAVRLGALVEGCIPAATLERAGEALAGMVQRARERGCAQVHLAATAALRDADNGAEAARALAQRLGLPVRVLSGEEEARLTWLGARSRLPSPRGVLVDMGGRSTELAAGEGDALLALTSLPFGHIIAAERSPEADPTVLEPLVDAALERRASVLRDLDELGVLDEEVVCTAGTALTLARVAAIWRGAPADVPRHGLRLPLTALDEALARLRRTPEAERADIPGFDPRRADTLLPGCVMLLRLLHRLGAQTILTSQAGLREGLLLDEAIATEAPRAHA
ncbi:MAG: hypothetical protein H6740_07835 [Alphaproteobacteria bacterium]|nr:hypothetical protein [Alphaproteobacteria bacterium]